MSPVPVFADALLRVVWSSIAASVLIVIAFSLLILGRVRALELRAAGEKGRALAYAALAGVGLLAFAAGVVYGLILVTQKS